MKPTQAGGRRNSLASALRALFHFPVTNEGMACIAIAALITLVLAPVVSRAMPDTGAPLALLAGIFIVTLGVVAAAAHALVTRRRARAATHGAAPKSPSSED